MHLASFAYIAVCAIIIGIFAVMIWLVSLIPTAVLAFIGGIVLVLIPLALVAFGILALLAAGMKS